MKAKWTAALAMDKSGLRSCGEMDGRNATRGSGSCVQTENMNGNDGEVAATVHDQAEKC